MNIADIYLGSSRVTFQSETGSAQERYTEGSGPVWTIDLDQQSSQVEQLP
jgi:hypothetical protein